MWICKGRVSTHLTKPASTSRHLSESSVPNEPQALPILTMAAVVGANEAQAVAQQTHVTPLIAVDTFVAVDNVKYLKLDSGSIWYRRNSVMGMASARRTRLMMDGGLI